VKKPKKLEVKEVAIPYKTDAPGEPMVRTQIYLTREEVRFLQHEARQERKSMAEVIRGMVDEKMRIPEEAWINNPMLEPTPKDSGSKGREDASLNHDHYAYGAPKKYKKVGGKWVLKREDEP
jgi:hypothetical protein